jgi:Pentapeptide repeats (8 copies)
MIMNRLIGGFRAPATLAVAVAALIGCSSALAATTGEPIAASSLFSIPTASGSLTGANDQHLTLRLTGTRGHLTRFTDRPLPQAFVVTNGDFARRFKQYVAGSRPSAVLTFTRADGQIPVSVELTVGQPRWNAHQRTWSFAATRIRKRTDNAARHFTRATLLIEGSTDCGQGVVQPYEDCEGADLAFVDLTDADLTGVNFSGADLSEADLTDADVTGAGLNGADSLSARLCGAILPQGSIGGGC